MYNIFTFLLLFSLTISSVCAANPNDAETLKKKLAKSQGYVSNFDKKMDSNADFAAMIKKVDESLSDSIPSDNNIEEMEKLSQQIKELKIQGVYSRLKVMGEVFSVFWENRGNVDAKMSTSIATAILTDMRPLDKLDKDPLRYLNKENMKHDKITMMFVGNEKTRGSRRECVGLQRSRNEHLVFFASDQPSDALCFGVGGNLSVVLSSKNLANVDFSELARKLSWNLVNTAILSNEDEIRDLQRKHEYLLSQTNKQYFKQKTAFEKENKKELEILAQAVFQPVVHYWEEYNRQKQQIISLTKQLDALESATKLDKKKTALCSKERNQPYSADCESFISEWLQDLQSGPWMKI